MRKRIVGTAMAAGILVGAAAHARAATITAFEELGDSTCSAANLALCADTLRDLYRIRDNGGSTTTENTDATLLLAPGAGGAGGNSIPSSFGVFNSTDFSYTHSLTWLSTSSFLSGVLTLYAYDTNGNNDDVKIGTVTLGNLGNGNNVITSVSFAGVQAYFVGNLLTVSIDKSNNDSINVFRSILTVTYDDGQTPPPLPGVPEPATLLLLGTGLGIAALYRRRQSRRA